MSVDGDDRIDNALADYGISRDLALPASERFSALSASFAQFQQICHEAPTYLRLASLARVARDYGAREVAVAALQRLSTQIIGQRSVNIAEPFLPPAKRFDQIAPAGAIGDWVLACTLEELETLAHFSSFYMGKENLNRLIMIERLGYASEEMLRRLSLVRRRFGLDAPA
jgi:hypothetical protein